MPEFIIKFPPIFSEESLHEVLPQIVKFLDRKDPAENPLVFDCENTRYSTMIGILLLSRAGSRVVEQGKRALCRFKDGEDSNIFRIILRAVGVSRGYVDKAVADSLVIPLHSCLSEKECLDVLNKKLDPFISAKLEPSDSVLRALDWAIWEALGNAGNHGYKVYDMANNYPAPVMFGAIGTNEFISIGISDMGQGIHRSLLDSGKPKYAGISNEQALKLAIQNGESGGIQDSPGFGLFGCAEIARNNNGRLVIMSGDRMLRVTPDSETIKSIPACRGTMIELKIPRDVKIDLSSVFGGDGPIKTDEISKLLDAHDE